MPHFETPAILEVPRPPLHWLVWSALAFLCGVACGALCCRTRSSPLAIDSALTELISTSSTSVSEQGSLKGVCTPATKKKAV